MSCRANERTGALIIGYGNALRTDDGVGPYVAGVLAARGYDAIATTQLLPELAERIARAALVIFIDCRADLEPGEIAVAPVGRESGQFSNLHFPSTPEPLLHLVKLLYDAEPEALLVGIGPASLEIGDRLSPVVEDAARRAIEEITKLATALPG